jgi:hypothetical protein
MSTTATKETETIEVVSEIDELTDALSNQPEATVEGGVKSLDSASKSIASRFGKTLTDVREKYQWVNGQIALAIILGFRFGIAFNGRPDIAGNSDVYRKAFAHTINRLMPMPDGANETQQRDHKLARASYSDTIGKRIQRLLFAEAVKYVNAEVGVSDAEVARLMTLDWKQVKTETNRKNQKLIGLVNELFDAGNKKRGQKHPRSQWERDDRVNGNSGNGNNSASDKDAESSRNTVKSFARAAASKNVDATAVLFSMADGLVSIHPLVTGSKRRYGKGGQAEVNRLLETVIALATGIHADVNGQSMTDDVNDAYCAAWDSIVLDDTEDEN